MQDRFVVRQVERCTFLPVIREGELLLVTAVRASDGFVKARANCRDCKDEAACRAWFLERSGEPTEFCPNGAFFTSLKSEK